MIRTCRARKTVAPVEVRNFIAGVQNSAGQVPPYCVNGARRCIDSLYKSNLLGAVSNNAVRWLLCFPLSGSYGGCNVPLIDTKRFGKSTLTGFASSAWNVNGLVGSALATVYVNTKFDANTALTGGDGHFLVWPTTAGASTDSTDGCQLNGATDGMYQGDGGGGLWWHISGTESSIASPRTTGFYIATRVASGAANYRKDTAQIGTVAASGNTYPTNLPLYLFGYNINNGNPIFFHDDRIWLSSIGVGLTDAQCDNLYKILSTLKGALRA
jgi:hypothetical protein